MSTQTVEPLSVVELGYIETRDGEFHCNAHGAIRSRWCEHLQRFIYTGQDADQLYAGQRLNVPVFPTSDIFAEVVIGVSKLPTGAALMWMEFTPDVGKQRKESLGFWNPGEGMLSIRAVITDWLRSQLDPNESFAAGRILTKCPSTATHSLREARVMKEKSVKDANWKAACLWNIVMEKVCTVCMEATGSAPDDNYGMPPAVAAGRGGFAPDPKYGSF